MIVLKIILNDLSVVTKLLQQSAETRVGLREQIPLSFHNGILLLLFLKIDLIYI